ncbi:flavodoxin FldB [Microbulbifer thermotolerans]|uniref:Flavodoxin n=1 Tax=Microbulbifer thermotolerans TaxID=252514 RepID=A0A143HM86_MICTH|nr:flavodoxin FldB [Microbulbifer thermotolerans]AMX02808.1 flavodoxin [Microbulbifer thermotolerans]MCX2779671.1 flavodoxin FldB [Microbulbifer thermotolerans]MCX2804898.1 flavodoxin FldB [Microbulbifer thermotolerans]MCX2831739.1 flavodoxin FldB [Microbulbifer thermotolerans]WKT59287.1 flavodoxin FldB [Microbulbifer thermotolerans]
MQTPLAPIGLFYGSSTCYTEMAAEKIRDRIGAEWIDLHNVADSDIALAEQYDFLIFGIPTWDYGELQEDWENVWDELAQLDLSGKTAALYGLGDQAGYPQWFQDALGYLHAQVRACGARTVGHWPAEGYTFEASKGLTEDGTHFVGLALDEESEFEKSDARLDQWCTQIMREFGLQS